MAGEPERGRLVLVRVPDAAGQAGGTTSLGKLDFGRGDLIFLHGDGVVVADPAVDQPWVATAAAAGAGLQVCSSAWGRRFAEDPPEPWRRGSLVQMWQRLQAADELICIGLGRHSRQRLAAPAGADCYGVELALTATAAQSREAVEVALAAAALDIEIRIVLSGSIDATAWAEASRPWRQFTDHGLARVGLGERPGAPGLSRWLPAAERLDAAALRDWRGSCRAWVWL